MVKDEKATAADKGKGKAVDTPAKDAAAKDKKGDKKDKKDEATEELSEEDQQLKSDLEMLVQRLQEDKPELYKPSLDQIRNFIRTSTSSMTAVPKPLKFLRPHYEALTALYEKWPAGENKTEFADILSVLGMTYSDEDRLDSLKYRLLAPTSDPGAWGHEYVRHLALEIGTDNARRAKEGEATPNKELLNLALSLVPFFLKHNAEADAADLLFELDSIELLPPYLDENTYARVCLYMVSIVPLLSFPEDVKTLKTAHTIYRTFNKLAQAITLAIRLNDVELIKDDFEAAGDDIALKKQLAFLVARQRVNIECEDEENAECFNNTRLSEHFLALAKELNILDPKTPEDIYKSHLENTRGPGASVDSAKQNLANSFVNSFANAGFTSDKLMLTDDDSNSWVYKNKDAGMLSATASIGMIHQWNVDEGLAAIDRFMNVSENHIKAGAALAVGMVNSGVRSESDPALALLNDDQWLGSKVPSIRRSAIMGLGLAYAGSQREDLRELLVPIIVDFSFELEISAMAAIALGLIFVGSGDGDSAEAMLSAIVGRDDASQLKNKWSIFLSLGLALLYVGRQEDADATLEVLKAAPEPIGTATGVLVEACSYAGTGNVVRYQSMLWHCNKHIDTSDDDQKGDDLYQSYAVLGMAIISMGEDIGAEMALRAFGHLMHYGEPNIRKTVPLAMGLLNASNPQMKVYDTLSRYSHDNDIDVAINAIFAMGLVGAGSNNARLAQLLRQLASYYHRDPNALFMVRIAQGMLHMGKGTLNVNPFHTDRSVMSTVSVASLLTVCVSLLDARSFILDAHHYLLYFIVPAMHPRFLITLDEDMKPLPVSVRVGQAVDVVGQAGRPRTITGWQTHNTPVLLSYGERAELEDEEYIALSHTLEGLVVLKKNPKWQGKDN
ncbi:armadillo-type protein [Pyronema domesticum]|uniref:26S proteasome regulatory subunit RPN1 n=1 Tax=Pyronema omphalodes (strain CBS 100304) TaxID=1076935 RepID=U4KZK5_PYROM|nr:armadillo-type protein [Pyronema domesticum]CCX05129.1 Similar to 26S proteasome regulatory subunit rpn-1; acc. no. Q7S8R8 [Pyronema omphalodes CBS 100304]